MLIKQLWGMIKARKAYVLVPVLLALVVLGVLAILGHAGGGAAAPFIYTLF